MTVFHYRAVNSTGQIVEDSIDASSLDAVNSTLESRGLTALSVQEARASGSATGGSKQRSLTPRDLALFSRQFATLLRAGLTVSKGLETLSRQAKDEHRPLLLGVQNTVDGGATVAEALSSHPRSFSPLYVATVGAAEQVGALPIAFRQLSEMLIWEIAVMRKVKTALRYPATVVLVALVAVLILQQIVLPQFIKIFSTLGGELPLPTRILITGSNFMTHYWWAIIIGVVGSIWALRWWLATPSGRLRWDRLILKVPLVGPILHRLYLARFARTFSLLQGNGLPILSSFEVIGETVGNKEMSRQLSDVRDRLNHGESLAESVDQSDIFSPMVKNMIRVGEQTGSLDESLLVVCNFYDDEIQESIDKLTQYIEPILTIVLGAFVLFLAMAIFMPWWNLTTLYK